MPRPREPYEISPPANDRAGGEWVRYQRSRALARFAHELRSWARAELLEHPRYLAKVAYRRRCLKHWQHYLDHGAPP